MSAISIGSLGGSPRLGRSDVRTRISRRSRLVITTFTAAVALLLAVSWVGGSVLGVKSSEAVAGDGVQSVRVTKQDGAVLMSATKPALIEHRVVPGDTLWSMATQVAGEGDPRSLVKRIQRLNGLEVSSVQVGDVILLPNGSE